MPGTHSFGEVSYTLTDLLVARYDFTAGTYGTPVALADGQMLKIEHEADNDQLRGYGQKTRLLTVTVGAKITLGQGGVDMAAMVIIAGVSTATSGTAPNRVRSVDFPAGGAGLPYWGVIGVAATDDGGTNRWRKAADTEANDGTAPPTPALTAIEAVSVCDSQRSIETGGSVAAGDG